MKKTTVLGGGTWGVTIATYLANRGHTVSVWEFDETKAQQLKQKRSSTFLPGLMVPQSVQISSDIAAALVDAEVIFSVVPSQFVRSTWKAASAHVPKNLEWAASLSKGIEIASSKRLSEVIAEVCPQVQSKTVIVSGPSHAEEVARDVPTALVAACQNQALAESAQELLNSRRLRVYLQNDVAGVEIAGALKNIYAIACGCADGLGFGDNTRAALISRSLYEMVKLGSRMGAQQETFFGLAGIGDLIVTATSHHSRNRLLGEKIGQGKTVVQALEEIRMVAEGYPTAEAAYAWIKKLGVDAPIIHEVYSILHESKSVKDSIEDLLARPPAMELIALQSKK